MERLSFNRSSSALNSPVTGAAAHMSLHLNQQCQRADAFPSPERGNRVTDHKETQTGSGKSPCPVGEAAIYGRLRAPSMAFFEKPAEMRRLPAPRQRAAGLEEAPCAASRPDIGDPEASSFDFQRMAEASPARGPTPFRWTLSSAPGHFLQPPEPGIPLVFEHDREPRRSSGQRRPQALRSRIRPLACLRRA
jgi:hypothetical protein